jgi:hypothetical protein
VKAKKIISLFVVLIVSIFIASGCGNKETNVKSDSLQASVNENRNDKRARCGSSARRDLRGVRQVTDASTVTATLPMGWFLGS